MIVKPKRKDARYPDLSSGQNYMVIGIEASDLRLLSDYGRPYLYPVEIFDVIDTCEPADWVTEYGEDGERYSYPRPLNSTGFFEDFFNADKKAVSAFWQVVNGRLAMAVAEA
jgi:hypothetical protein